LAEMGGGETANEAVDTEATHCLVAQAEAAVGVAAHDQAPLLDDPPVLVDGENAGPEWLASAARENADVVRVLKVLREHGVAHIEQGGQLGNGKVPDAPRVLERVGDACVEDEAPPRSRCLVDSAQRLNEERVAAPMGNHLDNALPGPSCELRADGYFGRLVALPAGMIWLSGGAESEAGFWHGELTADHGRRRGV
jgi:hypothetical protein